LELLCGARCVTVSPWDSLHVITTLISVGHPVRASSRDTARP
jgi:hypothetical protein